MASRQLIITDTEKISRFLYSKLSPYQNLIQFKNVYNLELLSLDNFAHDNIKKITINNYHNAIQIFISDKSRTCNFFGDSEIIPYSFTVRSNELNIDLINLYQSLLDI